MAKNTTTITATENLAPTPTPVVVAEQAAMDMGANVKCVVVPEAKPTPKVNECGYDIVVTPPAGKGVLAYLVGPGAEVILQGVDSDTATFTTEGDNLRITTATGGEILLLDFVAAAKAESCTSISTDAGKMNAKKFLAGLSHDVADKVADIEPAAGPAAVVRAAAPAVVSGRGGFTAPTIDGDGFGFGDNVLSTIIGPFAIPFGRDSIDYKEFPTDDAVPGAPTITPPNAPPVANDDTATVACGVVCGHSVTINALANDTDIEGDTVTITGISGLNPAQGTASIVGNQIVFTPASGVTGAVVFNYSISDGHGGTDVGQVTVNVTNTPPDAVNDTASTAHNTAVTVNVLANDTDAECKPGVSITAISGVNAAHGTASIVAGKIVFTPATGFAGTTTFNYSIADGCGGSDTATVTITVAAAPPVNDTDARNDTANTTCGNAVTVSVLANDVDAQSHTQTVTAVGTAPNGTVVLNANGTVTYTPMTGFVGADTFTYTITDSLGATDTATVTVNVTNTAPDALNDVRSTAFNTPITIAVLANDTDAESAVALDGIVTGPAHGVAVVNANGTITYTPTAGFVGTDTFTYRIDDACGDTDTAMVTVTVAGPTNDAPNANDDTISTACVSAICGCGATAKIFVLANDTDPNGDTLTITAVGTPAHGLATINSDGTISYKPEGGFQGTDSFTYTISDGNGGTDTATIVVTVTNEPPVAADDATTTAFQTPVNIALLANDSDPSGGRLKFDTVTVNPAHGTVSVDTNGNATYTPALGFTGTDTFTYRVLDGCGASDLAIVTVTVGAAPNTPPNAENDVATAVCNCAPVTIAVLSNDTDPNGDTLTVTRVISGPSHGVAVLNSNGTITYTPAIGWQGEDFFQYEVSDGHGGLDVAQVKVVTINNNPDAVNDAYATVCGTPVTFNVLANDTDPDACQTINGATYTQPAHGTVTDNPNGTLTYTPVVGFVGTDTFTYTIEDGCGGFDTATVTVVVTNTPPVATDDMATVSCGVVCGHSVTINVLANDTDTDGHALTLQSISGLNPAQGTASIVGNQVVFTPASGFTGAATFTYTVRDSCGVTDTATITVNVTNTPPDAVNDSGSTVCGHAVTTNVLANDTDAECKPGVRVTSASINPAQGTVTVNADGTITYTPAAGFVGTATYTYSVADGCGASDTATVTITVTNTPPDAQNDTATVSCGVVCGHSVTINVLANDTDTDGHALTLVSINGVNPAQGTASIVGNQVVFTPASGFTGAATFTYTVRDSCGVTDTATITVNVTNTPPDAVNDNAGTINAGGTVTTNVLANDTDAECKPGVHVTSASINPAYGTVVVNANGTITFTAKAGFSGDATYTYTIADGCGGTDTATVTVKVNPAIVPPPPPPPPPVSPLVIDLDGNGIHTIDAASSHAKFDLHNDGTPDATAWFSNTDGILVRDVNGDGTISNLTEIFGTSDATSSGYATLAADADSNADGVVNAADTAFASLQLWVDANSDGISQANELHALADYNIVSIDTHGLENRIDLNADSFISHTSTVTLADGSTLGSADVWFYTANETAAPAVTADVENPLVASDISLDAVFGSATGDDVAAMPAEPTATTDTYVASTLSQTTEDLAPVVVLHG